MDTWVEESDDNGDGYDENKKGTVTSDEGSRNNSPVLKSAAFFHLRENQKQSAIFNYVW